MHADSRIISFLFKNLISASLISKDNGNESFCGITWMRHFSYSNSCEKDFKRDYLLYFTLLGRTYLFGRKKDITKYTIVEDSDTKLESIPCYSHYYLFTLIILAINIFSNNSFQSYISSIFNSSY